MVIVLRSTDIFPTAIFTLIMNGSDDDVGDVVAAIIRDFLRDSRAVHGRERDVRRV